ncbi:MAG: thioesterase family protein [Caulobacteraceae bacterium]|nr:thioesterase family protein [Caulobacteraceae bacterium]
MARPFFELRSTHNPHRWYLPLDNALCVGPAGAGFMFGGVGLGAAIQAMEGTCGRPVVWATAQYLSHARPPQVVDFDVWVPVVGKGTSQARVIAHVDDKEILTVNAALGARDSDITGVWVEAPDVPPPLDCPEHEHWGGDAGGLHGQIETRMAKGAIGFDMRGAPRSEDGRLIMWMRSKAGGEVDAPMLAIFADHVPSGVGNALGFNAGGSSLDNTIRIVRLAPTEWVLCDISIHAVNAGFGHGAMRLFSEDRRLMATASQSVIVRRRDAEP